MKAGSLPTHVTFPPYWKAEIVLLTRAENWIIVSSCVCFWQHFLKKWSLIFRIVGDLISRNLYEQTCVCHYIVHSSFVNILNSVSQFIDKILCTVLCIPTHISVSGSTRFRVCGHHYKKLSQTEISSQHIKLLWVLSNLPFKDLFF